MLEEYVVYEKVLWKLLFLDVFGIKWGKYVVLLCNEESYAKNQGDQYLTVYSFYLKIL